MSLAAERRVTSTQTHVNITIPKATAMLKFQWSTSAAKLISNDENLSLALPSIDSDRSQRRVFGSISFLSDQTLNSFDSTTTRRSIVLPNISKQNQSPTLTNEDSKSCESIILSVDYKQLYQQQSQRLPSPVPVPIKQEKRPRKSSISPSSSHRRDSVCNRPSRRLSIRSRPSVDLGRKRSSVSSLSGTSSVSTKSNLNFGNQTYVRLSPTALRRLNVSQQYIREASKLYYNVKCKSFVPRISITKVC